LQDHHGHDHHPPHDDPDLRPHAVTMTRPAGRRPAGESSGLTRLPQPT
jgi:hypothetical protein